MRDWIIYFGLLDFVLIMTLTIVVSALIVWILLRRKFAAQLTEVLNGIPYGTVLVGQNDQIKAKNDEAQQLWDGAAFDTQLPAPLTAMIAETRASGGHNIRTFSAPSGLNIQVRSTLLSSGTVLLILEDQAAQHDQKIFWRNFISNVSHELKTPLTVIQGHIASVGTGLRANDPMQTSLRIVTQETARLTQLVDNLLFLSRFEMPDFNFDCRLINIEALVEDVMLQLSDLADARRVSLNLKREGNIPRIVADRARLKQVFVNLVDNAIKYNHEGGAVTVHIRAEDQWVSIQVQDTGEGIAPQDLPHIFEKMYRGERRQGRYVEGSGLGLSIVQVIIERHGGSISVQSQPGKGSTFTLALPKNADTRTSQNSNLTVTSS